MWYLNNHLIYILCNQMKMTIPHLSCICSMTTSLCYPYKYFSVFIPYLDTQRVFIGKNEFMIQFNISDVSFLTKYMTCVFLVKIFCWYQNFIPRSKDVSCLSVVNFNLHLFGLYCHLPWGHIVKQTQVVHYVTLFMTSYNL